jgi:subtilisin family serine protease
MRYVILRKWPSVDDNPFTEKVGAGEDGGVPLPVQVASQELEDRELGDLRRESDIDIVVPSIPFTLIEPFDEMPAEPSAKMAWGLEAVGATTSPQDGEGVTVAILDTGIDRTHPAFSGLALESNDLMDFSVDEEGKPGSAVDEHGHGTHVAATILGRDVDGARIGIARGIRRALIGKVLGPQGAPTERVYNAIVWALRRRADVISMSLGIDFPGVVTELVRAGYPADIAASRALEGYRSNVRLFDRLAAVVDALAREQRGALLVAAAGNESRRDKNKRFTVATAPPAAADGFISVGAVARTGDPSSPFAVAPFSNTGCLVAAPGVAILSAKLGGGLVNMSGTSMATPHVAGVIALWIQKLFPDGNRPNGWARDVQRAVESHVLTAPRQIRNDVGLGIVRAPLS